MDFQLVTNFNIWAGVKNSYLCEHLYVLWNKMLYYDCIDCATAICFENYLRFLPQKRQDHFSFWDCWRLPPMVATAELAQVELFVHEINCFELLSFSYWLFQSSLPPFLTVTPLTLLIDSSLFLCDFYLT